MCAHVSIYRHAGNKLCMCVYVSVETGKKTNNHPHKNTDAHTTSQTNKPTNIQTNTPISISGIELVGYFF